MAQRHQFVKRDDAHLQWIRSLPCCVPGCTEAASAHHVRSAANSGVGLKPRDANAVPVCHRHHMEGHSRGWETFEKKYGLDLAKLAAELSTKPPDGLF